MGGSRGGHTIGGFPTAHLGNLKELIQFIHGPNSGIDADTVDGKHAADLVWVTDVVTTATANKILKLDGNGKLPASITGNADGNAATATKWQTARTITIVGDADAPAVSFDGTGNVSLNLTLDTTGVTAGTYTKVTVDAKGRVTSATNMSNSDVTSSLGYTPVNKAGDTLTGFLNLHSDPTSNMNPVTKNYMDRRIAQQTLNGYQAITPVDGYFTNMISLFKINGNFGGWPTTAGTIITTNPVGDTYPGSIRQYYYAEGNLGVWQRIPNVTKTYNGIVSWSASATAALNALFMPSGAHGNGYYYKCTTAGTTGTTEPTWSTTIGATVTDGTAVWVCQGTIWGAWDKVLTNNTIIAGDIPNLDWTKITSGKPTTLGGYGITDGVNVSEVVTTATANKILKLNASGILPASITGNADTVDGKHVDDAQTTTGYLWTASKINTELLKIVQTKSATLPATAGWYRIAQSLVDIQRNSARFEIDWSKSGYHGQVIFNASTMFAAGIALNQTGFSAFGTSITKARIVYHTTYSSNYAYLEVYNEHAGELPINVQMISPLGWSLITPVAGSIPTGYTSRELAFIDGISTEGQLQSTVATGTSPLVVASTTVVSNLNSDLLDGLHASSFVRSDADSVKTGFLSVRYDGDGLRMYHNTNTSYSGIALHSKGNEGSDFGYIRFYDDAMNFDGGVYNFNDVLNGSGVYEEGLLVIGVENDAPYGSSADHLVLRSGARIIHDIKTLAGATATDTVHTEFRYNGAVKSYIDSNGKFIGNVQGNVTGNITGNVTGNADTASKWATARSVTLTGDVTGSFNIDGSGNVSFATAYKNSGVAAGTYTKVTVDAKGTVTAATTLSASDIPNLDWSKITSGKPTTLGGYGITDGVNKGGDTMTGALDVPQLKVGGKKLIELLSNNPELSSTVLNPIWHALRTGKKIYMDEEFVDGMNSMGRYNNSGGEALTLTRIDMPSAPNKSKKVIEVKNDASAAVSPNYGGIIQSVFSKANAVFVHLFKAKLPVGYMFNSSANLLGTGSTDYWLTDRNGTGKWETYIRVTVSGNTGTFNDGGHINVSGSPAPTVDAPLIWHIASSTVYEITDLTNGHGSNVHADLLDGKHGSDFAPAAHDHTRITGSVGAMKIGEATWSKNNGEAKLLGGIADHSTTGGASRFMIYSDTSVTNVYVDGTIYVNEGAYKVIDSSDVVTSATANKLLRLDGNGKLPTHITGNADGNAATASKLQTARSITLTGDITGTVNFDGSANVSFATSLGSSIVNNLKISKAAPKITLFDNDIAGGTYATIEFDNANSQGIQLRANELDSEMVEAGYGLILERMATNGQVGNPFLQVMGNIYSGTNLVVTSADVVTTATANKILKLDGNGKLPAHITGNADGNAGTASKWATSRTVTLTGDVTGSFDIDGSGNVSFATSYKNSGVIAGSYTKVTTDARGVVTAGENPTTLDGYGITDIALRYNALAKGVTWSRIVEMGATGGILGHSFLLNIAATRNSVVYNVSFIVNTAHNQNCSIIQLGNNTYSNLQIRGIVDQNGDGFIEIYDSANNVTNATTQSFNVAITKIKESNLKAITTFTDGTTIPSTHVIRSQFTTVSGNTVVANLSGNADTATKLATARSIALTGDVTGSVNFDGSGNVSIATTYKNSGVTAGTYRSVTVDAKGNITSGTNPTTISGYGLTDAVNKNGDTIPGLLTISNTKLTIGDGTSSPSTSIVGDLEHFIELRGITATYPNKLGFVAHHQGISTNALVHVNTDASTSYWDFISDDVTTEVRITGNKVWHAGNDGAGSGLDADLLDGIHASQFVRTDAASTISSPVTFGGSSPDNLIINQGGGYAGIRFNSSVNTGSDYGYIRYYDDVSGFDTAYDINTSSAENSALVIGVENDKSPSSGDMLVLRVGNKLIIDTKSTAAAGGSSAVAEFRNDGAVVASINTSGTFVGDVAGNATTATRLATARTISHSGDMTGSATFDGSANVTIAMTLANTGVTAGTYNNVTVDAKGRVTSANNLTYTKRVNLLGQLQKKSYQRSVIALVDLTNTNPSANSYSIGMITMHRNNGLEGTTFAQVGMEKRYNTTTPNYSLLTMGNNVPGVRACTFTYNGVKYGGIEFYISAAEYAHVEFNGNGNFDVFGLDYYDTQTAAAVIAEVNDSIEFASPIAVNGIAINGNTVWNASNFTPSGKLDATANAVSASKWATSRTVTLTGDVTGSFSIDGTGNVSFATAYKNSGVTAGTYRSVTVDAKGNITAGTNPTTLSGYGITDAAPGGYGLGGTGKRYVNGTDLNTIKANGWYDVQNPVNGVTGLTWHNMLVACSGDNGYVTQIVFGMVEQTGNMWIRTMNANVWGTWRKFWNDSNDGVGSGLDADLLDGLQGTSYMRADANTSTTGTLSTGGDLTVGGIVKCGKTAWRVTFNPGEIRKTIGHNIGTTNYVTTTGINSSARHANWENPTATTIDIVLDSPYYDGTILVDVIMMGY